MLQHSHKCALKNVRYSDQPQEMNANADVLVPLLYKRYANAVIAGAAGRWWKGPGSAGQTEKTMKCSKQTNKQKKAGSPGGFRSAGRILW